MESPQSTQTTFGRVTNCLNNTGSSPKRMSKKSSKTSKVAKFSNNNTNTNNTRNNRLVRAIQLQQTEGNALAIGLATQRCFRKQWLTRNGHKEKKMEFFLLVYF